VRIQSYNNIPLTIILKTKNTNSMWVQGKETNLLYLLHDVLANIMHELVSLLRGEGFIADGDRAIFMGFGRSATDEGMSLRPAVRTTIFQEHGQRGVWKGINNEVRHFPRSVEEVALSGDRLLKGRGQVFCSRSVLGMGHET
jgi:hypothetical protein